MTQKLAIKHKYYMATLGLVFDIIIFIEVFKVNICCRIVTVVNLQT